MVRVALMQPYLFPYLGYFQLIRAVDVFVIYDDVQYMKGGWINRNRILVNGQSHYLTLPVPRGRLGEQIREKRFSSDFATARQRILAQVHHAYRGAPRYRETVTVVEESLACDDPDLAVFLARQLGVLCGHLGIETPLRMSSRIDKDDAGLTGSERVLSICRALRATTYINAIGGRCLYGQEDFTQAGVQLRFLQMHDVRYEQFDNTFVPSLSIIDVLMFNPIEKVRDLLRACDLVT